MRWSGFIFAIKLERKDTIFYSNLCELKQKGQTPYWNLTFYKVSKHLNYL